MAHAPTPFDPDLLRAQCRAVVADSSALTIDRAAAAAVEIPPGLRRLPPWDDAGFAAVPRPRVVPWLIAYNAVNYSYWPDAGPRWWIARRGQAIGRDDEALAVMTALATEQVQAPAWAGGMRTERLAALFEPAPGAGRLPLMAARAAAIRELHEGYRRLGGPRGLMRAAGRSALRFVALVADAFPAWDDRRTWRGEELRFLKRAQLCAAMIHGRLGGEAFDDAERLTAFADYRLPQVLRALGVLRVDPALALRIERGDELPRGGEAEVALRAAAVDGAERIAEATGLSTLVVDHFLWRTAVRLEAEGRVPPFHKTRCTDY